MMLKKTLSIIRGLMWPIIIIFAGLVILTKIDLKQLNNTFTPREAILQGSIYLEPAKPIPGVDTSKIQPGTPLKISTIVENVGRQTSLPGQLYIRYAFAKPLENEMGSVIFQTEKKPLPEIEPGKKITITFDATHLTPSLLDFVRHDWPIREYQAIDVTNQQEHVIGTLALTFSAYYYPGIRKEIPVTINHEAKDPV